MIPFLERTFGPNFRTTLSGSIALAAGAITFAPQSVAFLPPGLRSYVTGIAGLITLASGGTFVYHAKDKQVCGGEVRQPAPAFPRTAGVDPAPEDHLP